MNAETLLKENVGWLEDVGVEQVNFEVVDEKGLRSVETYAMDDEINTDKGFAYFYALGDEGFHWGHIGSGDYTTFFYTETLFDIMEYEDIDDKWLAENPKRVGSIITDGIIDDKDLFESFWYLTSYKQIYADFPLINCLRDYLTEYYETRIEAEFPEEVENARLKKTLRSG